MPNLALTGKVIITGEIETVTGLHIGGASAGLDIGGIDNPMIRHPVSREPYIPGSSLRGKMRALLDRHLGKEANKFIQRREPQVRVHECEAENEYDACAVCQIFGVTPGDQRRTWTRLKPARLIVRDVHLGNESAERLRRAKTDLPFAEVKWEAVIDRITSAATPRQNERVPAGIIFEPFEFVYSLYDLDGAGCAADIEWLPSLFRVMEMLEDDYLGGYGSRGAGKIAFRNVIVTYKPKAYYEGKAKPVAFPACDGVAALRPDDYVARINESLQG